MRALLLLMIAATSVVAQPRSTTVVVPGGVYRPTFPATPTENEVPVAAFRIDRVPVTNAAYLAFVRANPAWRRDRIKPLLADQQYLAHWRDADALGEALANGPVVRVSWFAARAYCAWRGGHLPLEKEWELAARDATPEAQLAWYTQPTPKVLPAVGGSPNKLGISDLHGLIWEWIEDFSAALVSSDSRDPAGNAFCGGTGATSRDPSAYASFLRIAFRSSLQARFTTANLGFRCAYDIEASK